MDKYSLKMDKKKELEKERLEDEMHVHLHPIFKKISNEEVNKELANQKM